MNYNKFFAINKFEEKPALFTNRHKITNLDKTINSLPKFSCIIIREYDLNVADRENFIKDVMQRHKNKKINMIIAKDITMAQKHKADGVHFSDLDKIPLAFFRRNSFRKDFILSLSCHSLKSLIKYSKYNINQLFISPIYPTTSHNNSKALGSTNLAKISLNYKRIPYSKPRLLALGGVSDINIKKIRNTNITSFGAIDYFTL